MPAACGRITFHTAWPRVPRNARHISRSDGDVFRMRDMTLGGGRARMTVGTAAVVLKVSLADDGTVVVGGLKEAGGESELMVAVTADF